MLKISELIHLQLPLVLASKSPRRKKLLEQLGFDFTIIPSNHIEEKLTNLDNPSDFVKKSAFAKASDVAKQINYEAIVLGADTIVVLDKQILHKPKDKNDAINILKTLSNKTHIVYTGIAILHGKSSKYITDVQTTEVSFRKLMIDEIITYVNSGSPMDKAGAYGIQDDFGAVFVNNIKGCYYNIVGLPLEMFYSDLIKLLSKI